MAPSRRFLLLLFLQGCFSVLMTIPGPAVLLLPSLFSPIPPSACIHALLLLLPSLSSPFCPPPFLGKTQPLFGASATKLDLAGNKCHQLQHLLPFGEEPCFFSIGQCHLPPSSSPCSPLSAEPAMFNHHASIPCPPAASTLGTPPRAWLIGPTASM